MGIENVSVYFRRDPYTKMVNYYRVEVVKSANNRWIGTVHNLENLAKITGNYNVLGFVDENYR